MKTIDDTITQSAHVRIDDLKPGQIRQLYFWVHPQWSAPWTCELVDDEMRVYKDFVDALEVAPQVGLVQVSDAPRTENMKNSAYAKLIRELRKFNKYAEITLGRRYLVWNRTRFFDGRNTTHVQKLVKHFNLIKTDQRDFVREKEQYMAQDQKLLAKICVFGKERDTCPLSQAYYGSLHNIAAVVKYIAEETPENIRPTLTSLTNECYVFEQVQLFGGER